MIGFRVPSEVITCHAQHCVPLTFVLVRVSEKLGNFRRQLSSNAEVRHFVT
jgi:hypothetical protein